MEPAFGGVINLLDMGKMGNWTPVFRQDACGNPLRGLKGYCSG
jgi:hypothetical protein